MPLSSPELSPSVKHLLVGQFPKEQSDLLSFIHSALSLVSPMGLETVVNKTELTLYYHLITVSPGGRVYKWGCPLDDEIKKRYNSIKSKIHVFTNVY